MRTNKFNSEYIMIDIKEIDEIVYSIPGKYPQELRDTMHILKKKIFEKVMYEDIVIPDKAEIAIKRNSMPGILITNNLTEVDEVIDESMIKNAIIIAINENNYDCAKMLTDIIISQKIANYSYQSTYSTFEEKYGKTLADFTLSNGNLDIYQTSKTKYPHKDMHVFLYEDNDILETDLCILGKGQKPEK